MKSMATLFESFEKKRMECLSWKALFEIRLKEGDAQAHTPKPKNYAVIIPKDLWNFTTPECYGLLGPRSTAFLIAVKSPPGKYDWKMYAHSLTSLL